MNCPSLTSKGGLEKQVEYDNEGKQLIQDCKMEMGMLKRE